MKRTDITALFPDIDKEKLDKIMDLNGADVSAAKAELESLRGQLAAAQSEIAQIKAKQPETGEDAAAQIKALKAELDGMKKAATVRDLREKVAKATGVPASLLTAETEEACKSQADAIRAYAQPDGYPKVRDAGEVHGAGGSATRDKFAEWFNENI